MFCFNAYVGMCASTLLVCILVHIAIHVLVCVLPCLLVCVLAVSIVCVHLSGCVCMCCRNGQG